MIKIFVVASLLVAANALCLNPATVTPLDPTKYVGLWYQAASNPFVQRTQEHVGVCVTAKYAAQANNIVSVLNEERQKTIDGPKKSIAGYAYIPDKTQPGKLLVHLNGVPVTGQYWVLFLGPEVSNQYTYAVVSDELCAYLYILSRTPKLSAADEQTIKNYLSKTGFDVDKEWIPTLQDGCTYTN